MTNDLAIYNAPVPDRMRYAEALSGASLLPDSYRGKPANLLLALEYGGALGIAPMVAVQEIHIIKGKPTLSALLQAALVRRAGHVLRVTGDHTSATCSIIRSDDPDFTFETTWTIERAKAAGLLTNDSWRKYPDNMLKWRAISECVRNACADVIAGFGYTPEEMGDDTVDPYPQTDSGAATPAVSPSESGAQAGSTPADSPAPESDIEDAVIVVDGHAYVLVDGVPVGIDPEPGDVSGEAPSPGPVPDEEWVRTRTSFLRHHWSRHSNADGEPEAKDTRHMWAALKTCGDEDKQREFMHSIVTRDWTSSKELTALEVRLVTEAAEMLAVAS